MSAKHIGSGVAVGLLTGELACTKIGGFISSIVPRPSTLIGVAVGVAIGRIVREGTAGVAGGIAASNAAMHYPLCW